MVQTVKGKIIPLVEYWLLLWWMLFWLFKAVYVSVNMLMSNQLFSWGKLGVLCCQNNLLEQYELDLLMITRWKFYRFEIRLYTIRFEWLCKGLPEPECTVCSTAAISQKKYSFDDFGKLEIKTHGVESSMIGLKNRHGVGIFPSSNQFSRFRVLMIVMTLCQPCSLSHSH